MFKNFFKWLFGGNEAHHPAPNAHQGRRPASVSQDESDLDGFAPLKEAEFPVQSSVQDSKAMEPATPSAGPDADAIQSFICREPMLDSDGRMAGYEFMLRKAPTSNVRHETPSVLRLYDEILIRNVIDMDIGRLLGSRLAFVGISPGSLGCRLFETLPRNGVVLAIHSSSHLTEVEGDEAWNQIKLLKDEDFLIALEDVVDVPEMGRFIRIADFVMINVLTEDSQHLSNLVSALRVRNPEARLIAKNVESSEAYEVCRKLGFDFFQGPFLTRLDEQEQPKVGTNHVHLFDLLNLVQKDADPVELVKVFKLDPTLTFKFLRYINSAGGGLVSKVASIDHAIAVLGQKKLYRWLTLLLYSAGTASQKDLSLMENAMIRGRMTESLGRDAFSANELDNLFILGFFSLLDVLLRMPMGQALSQIKLSEELVQALVHKEGKYAPYLELAIACEQFEPARIAALAAICKLNVQKVNLAHVDAMLWAMEVEK